MNFLRLRLLSARDQTAPQSVSFDCRLTKVLELEMDDPKTALPPHVEQTARAIEQVQSEHHNAATAAERLTERITAELGRPVFLTLLLVFCIAWIGANLVLLAQGRIAFDAPPFSYLDDLLTLGAVIMAGMILTTQRRADQLASHREQMTLHLALLSEQKVAKVIALLEELRRDSPQVHDRVDVEADRLAMGTDPHQVSAVVKEIAQNAEPKRVE